MAAKRNPRRFDQERPIGPVPTFKEQCPAEVNVAEWLAIDSERLIPWVADTLVQKMHRAGLDLHCALERVDDDYAAQKIRDATDALEHAINTIRTVIFDRLSPDREQ